MNLLTKLLISIAIAMILQFTAVFAYKVGDKVNRERIKKVKEQNKRLVEEMESFENDYLSTYKKYHSIYENMVHVNTMKRELEKENEELKKQLDKQENVTYNYYINK